MTRLTKWSLPVLAFALSVALIGVQSGGAQDAAEKKQEKGKVSGTVLLEDGSPAVGASVRLLLPGGKKGETSEGGQKPEGGADKPAPQQANDQKDSAKGGDKGGDKPADEEKPKKDRPKPVAETTTDAEGKFELEAPAGKYRLTASIKGKVTGMASRTIAIKAGETVDNVQLKIKPKKAETTPAAPAE